MNKIVINAFKAIAFSMIFVIVWDVAFYMFKVYSLNQKMESVLTTMQQEVSINNYLPEGAYTMYESVLKGIATDMNGSDADKFVLGYNINYGHECSLDTSGVSGLTFSRDMQSVGDYGDVAIIELKVTVNSTLLWYNASSSSASADRVEDRDSSVKVLTYIYQVPCLRYTSITN